MLNYSIVVMSAKPGTKKENITETKAYAKTQVTSTMSMDAFAQHIADHGSKYGRGDVYAILAEAVDCLRELILEGKKVTLGDLGAFYPSLKSTGAEDAASLTAANIKALNVRWAPGKRFRNLRDDASFQCVPSRRGIADTLAAERGNASEGGNDGEDEGNSMD